MKSLRSEKAHKSSVLASRPNDISGLFLCPFNEELRGCIVCDSRSISQFCHDCAPVSPARLRLFVVTTQLPNPDIEWLKS